MHWWRTIAWAAVTLAAVGVVSAEAWGQQRGKPAATPPAKKPTEKKKPEHFNARGVIESITPTEVKFKADNGESVTAKFSKSAEKRVSGTAERSCLQPGVLISFDAPASKKLKKIRGSVAKLKIFTASRELMPGLLPAAGGAPPPMETAEDQEAEWKASVVSGQIVTVQDNVVILSVPDFSQRLKIELTPTAKIEVDIDDLSVLKPGDKVSGQGTRDDTSVTLSKLQFRLDKPLEKLGRGGGPTKPASRTRPR